MTPSSTTEPFEGYLPGSTEYRRVLIALFAAGVATFVLIWSTQALLPAFVDAFAITPAQSAMSLSVTTAGLAVALLVAGPLSEAIGRTRMIHLSLWTSALIAVACAFAPSWHVLVVLRLLQGITLAGLPAVATAYLREELHPSVQARAAGLYIGGNAIGGMAGRLVTAPMDDLGGWRWAMGAAAVLALAGAVAVAFTLPRSRNFVPRPTTAPDLLAQTRRALADPALLALYGIGACGMGVLSATFNSLGFRLTSAPFHLTEGGFSLIYLLYAFGATSSAMTGRAADRFGQRAVAPVGCLLGLVGIALTLTSSLPTIIVGIALLTVGFFSLHGLASGWVVARSHALGASTGQAASLYLFTYYVGAAVFGNLGSAAWAQAGWAGPATLVVVLLLIAAGLTMALRHTRPLVLPAH
ncbi:MFS transporter [Nocardioides sp.]|uniref:MFS transporter n=1 Tax=Nocardioides sp. TaxID=35761 RepID=UPI002624BABF|nr:MFS transporter [Nocardioides sp.]